MDPATTGPVAPLTAHLTTSPAASEEPHINPDEVHLSREQVPWGPEVWARIDRAVAHEVRRTRKVTKFVPEMRISHHQTNVEQDVVLQNLTPGSAPFAPPIVPLGNATPPILNVYEGANLTIIELSVKWALSHAQVRKENERLKGMNGKNGAAQAQPEHPGPNGSSNGNAHHHEYHPSSTAVLLARRTANTLCLGVDALVWLGLNAFPTIANPNGGIPLFNSQTVLFNGIPVDAGLTCIGGPNQPLEILQVAPVNTPPAGQSITAQYSTNTVAMISQAVTDLAGNGYGGPYAAALPPYFFAESWFPLNNTLQRPADLIVPLLDGGYHDSAVLPGLANPQNPNPGNNPLNLVSPPKLMANAQGIGFVVSLGGNVVEFVNGLDPVTAFSQIDGNGNYIFQLKTRAALKISDSRSLVALAFM